MSASPAYSEEKGGSSSLGEPEYGHDPASGGIFSSDYKRVDTAAWEGARPSVGLWLQRNTLDLLLLSRALG
ncbi:exocyst complex component 3 [Platysternon megacephalum]|uniref:Exocyst complex component 3 n=1 Tax=Platysternon megacephalum TaxID=55544 RepID=A0A4D9E4M7_9SAUR|nr:exocyst complex component 3 [Platysternon megacephalum]